MIVRRGFLAHLVCGVHKTSSEMDFSSLGNSSRYSDGFGSSQGSAGSAGRGVGLRVPQDKSRHLDFSNLGVASVMDIGFGITSQNQTL